MVRKPAFIDAMDRTRLRPWLRATVNRILGRQTRVAKPGSRDLVQPHSGLELFGCGAHAWENVGRFVDSTQSVHSLPTSRVGALRALSADSGGLTLDVGGGNGLSRGCETDLGSELF